MNHWRPSQLAGSVPLDPNELAQVEQQVKLGDDRIASSRLDREARGFMTEAEQGDSIAPFLLANMRTSYATRDLSGRNYMVMPDGTTHYPTPVDTAHRVMLPIPDPRPRLSQSSIKAPSAFTSLHPSLPNPKTAKGHRPSGV